MITATKERPTVAELIQKHRQEVFTRYQEFIADIDRRMGNRAELKEAELELEERKKKEKILEEEKKKLDDEKEINNKKIEITDPVGIKLNTHDVFTDDDEDEINGKVKEVDEIKINIPSDREVSIPTEIFIEEPKEEKN